MATKVKGRENDGGDDDEEGEVSDEEIDNPEFTEEDRIMIEQTPLQQLEAFLKSVKIIQRQAEALGIESVMVCNLADPLHNTQSAIISLGCSMIGALGLLEYGKYRVLGGWAEDYDGGDDD